MPDFNNIPAFPGARYSGMTMLDYFIAHAPAQPPNWWKPEMDKQPVRIMFLKTHFTDAQEQTWLGFYDTDENQWYDTEADLADMNVTTSPNIPQSFKDKVAELVKKIEDSRIAIQEWEQKEQYERLIQWPLWWATQIMMRTRAYPGSFKMKEDNDFQK